MEEVGFVQNGGKYRFDEPTQLNHEHLNDEWIAYCGGCGKGVAVEWLPENRVKVLLENNRCGDLAVTNQPTKT